VQSQMVCYVTLPPKSLHSKIFYQASDKLKFVEWTYTPPVMEYKLVYYFYLSDSFVHWNNENLQKWIREGDKSVILFTNWESIHELPRDAVKSVEIDSDKYNSLLLGMKK